MLEGSKRKISRVSGVLGIVAAVGVGFLLSKVLSPELHLSIDPHRWLEEHDGDRLYVSAACGISDQAVEFMHDNPEGQRFVIIPVDTTPSPQGAEKCRKVLDHIGEQDGPWWLWLPESYLCERLTTAAWNWSFAAFDGSSPGLVVADEILEPGFGPPHVARLQALRDP